MLPMSLFIPRCTLPSSARALASAGLCVVALFAGCAGIMDTPGEWNAFEKWKIDTRAQKSSSALGRSKEEISAANVAALARKNTPLTPTQSSPNDQVARGLIAAAERLASEGNWREAAAVYEQARPLAPLACNYAALLGRAYSNAGEPARALAEYRAALAVQPQQAELWNELGALQLREKNLVEAESSLRQAIALKTDLAAAWLNLGNTLAAQGRTADAFDAFAHAQGPAAAHASLAVWFSQAGQPAEAAQAWQHARDARWRENAPVAVAP